MIAAAGVVERIVNKGDSGLWTAANSVKLFDQGVYDGQIIKLPDTGGQWSHNFETAALQVQVTGSDPIQVRERLGTAVARIRSTTDALQAAADVKESQYIETRATESPPTVFRVSGSRVRTLAISLVIGLIVTLWMFQIANRVTSADGSGSLEPDDPHHLRHTARSNQNIARRRAATTLATHTSSRCGHGPASGNARPSQPPIRHRA